MPTGKNHWITYSFTYARRKIITFNILTMPASINEILAPDIFEAGGVSGLWPSPPAITQPHHVTSVDRCSCCRQTNHHSTFGLVSLLCPSLRSLWTLISTLGPLHRS